MSGTSIFDVAIIGAGLAGASAATALSNAGLRVALVEMRPVHPNEFRAEKFGEIHMSLFEKLGLAASMAPFLTPMQDAWVYRHGQVFAHGRTLEYGFAYGPLVNGLRAALPPAVRLTIGKVAQIACGPDLQRLTLASGDCIEARLIVVATGLGETIRRSLGMQRIEISRQHSMSLGFNLAKPAEAYPFETLTYYGHDPAARMAYLTLFPVGGAMRGNFFVYRGASEEWVRQFRVSAPAMMRQLMPEISGLCGDFALAGHVEARTVDLSRSEGHVQAGVVLLGDAFASTCPVPGVGVRRAISDVAQLAEVHLPRWFSTPGMGVEKIAEFYDDPVKLAIDGQAMAASLYARSIATEQSLIWMARRFRNAVARRGYAAARTILGGDVGAPPFEPASMSGPVRQASEAPRAA